MSEAKTQVDVEKEIREQEDRLEALRKIRESVAEHGSEKAHGKSRGRKPMVRKPRLGAVVIAPGVVATTVPGSLYSTILMKMAILGRFALQDRYFHEFRDDPSKDRAKFLLNEIGVAFAELEQSVRRNHEYRNHCERRTVLLKNRAAHGDKKAIKVLSNPEICHSGTWVGDLHEAVGILKGGAKLGQWSRGRNVRILRRIKLMFATSQREGQVYCYMYRRENHPEFAEARRLVKE